MADPPSLLSGWRHLCSLCWVFFSCLDCMWKWKLFFRVNVPILTQLLAKDVQLQKFSNLIVLRSQMLDTNIPDIQILTVGANFFFCEKIAFKYLHIIHHHWTTLQKFEVYVLFYLDCQFFYICISGQARRNGCTDGQVFNKETLACDAQFNVKNDVVCQQWYNETFLEGSIFEMI